MTNKTSQVLAYILAKKKATVTELMKLSYLSDLVQINKTNKQITEFKYIRYNYGPFDSSIYTYLRTMTDNHLLDGKAEYTSAGSETVYYSLSEGMELNLDKLSDEEIESINEVLENLKGHGAKALTEVAYKTRPMLALGATLGGKENIGAQLNLKA